MDSLLSIMGLTDANICRRSLHGVWDADNPIGNHVLAHTNLTEIDLAMNLLWRNNIPAAKLNLGLGFYGRSFTLTDPSCTRPGCKFKGGANPGHVSVPMQAFNNCSNVPSARKTLGHSPSGK